MARLAPPLTRLVMVPVLPLLSDDGDGEDCSDGDAENCWDDWLAQLEATVIIPISIRKLNSLLLHRGFKVNYAPCPA
jgi:hypothetical protein